MPRYFGRVQYNCRTVAGACGMSEIYPLDSASAAAANTTLTSLVLMRQAMMVNDVTCVYGGISDSDIRGDFIPNLDIPDTVGTFAVSPPDQTGPFLTTRLLRQQNAAGTKRGMRQVRLLPVSQFNGESLIFAPLASWIDNYELWQGQLRASVCIATRIAGAVTPPFWTFTPITNTFDERDTTRRIGRPFELLAGRRVIR